MKVIAVIENMTTVSSGKYLVEATGDELAQLQNKAMSMRMYDKNDCDRPVFFVGATFPVSDYWKQLQAADNVRDRLNSVAASLYCLSEAVKNVGVPDLKAGDVQP